MTTSSSARLLDITRLSTRAGRVLTGVDRVELAYLNKIAGDETPAFAICRTALGFVLLDRAGMQSFAARFTNEDWQKPDFISLINPRLNDATRLGQTAVRSLSIARSRPRNLSRLLSRLPIGFSYFNVGHSNLTEVVFAAVRAIKETRIVVMIHDTIPLDFPQFQRPETVRLFAAKLRRVACYADQVICPSVSALGDAKRHLQDMGRVPQLMPASLGVDVTHSASSVAQLPEQPYFMTVGTIEPRKNHGLLLDVWAQLPEPRPTLYICGHRGWLNEDVFARLDAGIDGVVEVNDADDAQIAALLDGASGFLFPTLAEGFGLPPIEAAARGVPVVCSDIAVCHETLGGAAVYLDPKDRYRWEKEVMRLAVADRSQAQHKYIPPSWDTHFKIVFTVS